MFQIQEHSTGLQQLKHFTVDGLFSLIRLVVNGKTRHNHIKGAVGVNRIDPGALRKIGPDYRSSR